MEKKLLSLNSLEEITKGKKKGNLNKCFNFHVSQEHVK